VNYISHKHLSTIRQTDIVMDIESVDPVRLEPTHQRLRKRDIK